MLTRLIGRRVVPVATCLCFIMFAAYFLTTNVKRSTGEAVVARGSKGRKMDDLDGKLRTRLAHPQAKKFKDVGHQEKFKVRPKSADKSYKTGKRTIQLYVAMYVSQPKGLSVSMSRAQVAKNTWGKDPLLAKMEIFTTHEKNRQTDAKMKVIPLKGLTSNSPLHWKQWSMMKYICEHHIQRYQWFLIADDNVYMNIKQLVDRILLPNREAKIINFNEKYDKSTHCSKGLNRPVVYHRKSLSGLCPHIEACYKNVSAKPSRILVCLQKSMNSLCKDPKSVSHYRLTHLNANDLSGKNVNAAALKQYYKAFGVHPVTDNDAMKKIHAMYKKMKPIQKHRKVKFFKKNAWKHHAARIKVPI